MNNKHSNPPEIDPFLEDLYEAMQKPSNRESFLELMRRSPRLSQKAIDSSDDIADLGRGTAHHSKLDGKDHLDN